jgi:regulator of replication initiation timing
MALLLGLGGLNISKTVNNIVNQSLTDLSTSMMVKLSNDVDAPTIATQIRDLNFTRADFTNCAITDLSQKINIKQTFKTLIEDNQEVNIEQTLKDQLKTDITNKLDQSNEKLNIGQKNISTIINNVQNINFTDLSKTFDKSLNNSIEAAVDASQTDKLDFTDAILCAPNGTFRLGQDINIDKVIDQTLASESVIKAVDKVIKESLVGVENVVVQENKGLDMGLIIALAVIGGVILIALFVFLIYKFNKQIKNGIMYIPNKISGSFKKSNFGLKKKLKKWY